MCLCKMRVLTFVSVIVVCNSFSDIAWLARTNPGIDTTDTTTCGENSEDRYKSEVFNARASLSEKQKALLQWTRADLQCTNPICAPFLVTGAGLGFGDPAICYPCKAGYDVSKVQVSDSGDIPVSVDVDKIELYSEPDVYPYNLKTVDATGQISLTGGDDSKKACWSKCVHSDYCVAMKFDGRCYGRTLAVKRKVACGIEDKAGVWHTIESTPTGDACHEYTFRGSTAWQAFAKELSSKKTEDNSKYHFWVRLPPSIAQACAPCKPGHFRPPNSTIACQPCPDKEGAIVEFTAGAISAPTGCVQCTNGKVAKNGQCVPPPMGMELPVGAVPVNSQLVNCTLGKQLAFVDDRWKCEACPTGKYQPAAPKPNPYPCKPCDSGKWSSATGATACTDCAAGRSAGFGATSGADCTPACFEAGKYCDKCETQPCKSCQPGKFARVGNSKNHCTDCESGRYAKFPGTSECMLCPTGKYSKYPATDCIGVTAGHFINNGHEQPCKEGTFSHKLNSEACDPCGIGTYQPEEGASSCKPCEAGKYQENEGEQSCKPCPIGKYLPDGAPRPFYACLEAPPGTYVYGTGNTGVTSCDANTYTVDKKGTDGKIDYALSGGHQNCTRCDAGRWTNGNYGFHTNMTGRDACIMCPYHQYRQFNVPSDDCSMCKIEEAAEILGYRLHFAGFGAYTDATHVSCNACCETPTWPTVLGDVGISFTYLLGNTVSIGALQPILYAAGALPSYCHSLGFLLKMPLFGPLFRFLIDCIRLGTITFLIPVTAMMGGFGTYFDNVLMKVLCVEMWSSCDLPMDQCWGEPEGDKAAFNEEYVLLVFGLAALPCLLCCCLCICLMQGCSFLTTACKMFSCCSHSVGKVVRLILTVILFAGLALFGLLMFLSLLPAVMCMLISVAIAWPIRKGLRKLPGNMVPDCDIGIKNLILDTGNSILTFLKGIWQLFDDVVKVAEGKIHNIIRKTTYNTKFNT